MSLTENPAMTLDMKIPHHKGQGSLRAEDMSEGPSALMVVAGLWNVLREFL